MTRPKSEVPSIRTTAEVKVLDYAEGQGLTVPELVRRGCKGVGK